MSYDRTYTQTEISTLYLKKLLKVTEPSFNWTWTSLPGNYIFAFKVDPLNLKSLKQAKNFPVGLPSSPIKIEANLYRGSWVMIGRIKTQTNEITILYIETHINLTFEKQH